MTIDSIGTTFAKHPVRSVKNISCTMLNRTLNLLTAASALMLVACEGKSIGSFSADEEIPATRIEGGGLVGVLPTNLTPFSLDVKDSEAFQANDYDFLNEIKIDDITLRILPESENTDTDSSENGIPDDFSFINTLSLFIQAEINGENSRALIAELPAGWEEIRSGTREFSMLMQDLDILSYVEAQGGYTIESEASGTAPADDVVFGGTVDYGVKIGFR